jgi:hypothetical protein
MKNIPLRILKLLSIILLLLFALVVVRSAYPDHHFFDGPGWFIMLRDAPEEHDYTGQAGKGLVVGTTEDTLVFSTLSGTGGSSSTALPNDAFILLHVDQTSLQHNTTETHYTFVLHNQGILYHDGT